jgi:hypothetical protein
MPNPMAKNEIMAAAANRQKQMMTDRVGAELRRLGLSDGSMKAAGTKKYSIPEVDAAMKAVGWNTSRCMAFKYELNALGLLAH